MVLVTVLSQRGHEVIVSARHVTDLADLEVTCKIALDVTHAESTVAVAAEIGQVDVVMNNAAMVVEGPVEAIPIPVEVVQLMFETNVFGPLWVIQAFLPGWLITSGVWMGRICTSSSTSTPCTIGFLKGSVPL